MSGKPIAILLVCIKYITLFSAGRKDSSFSALEEPSGPAAREDVGQGAAVLE